MAASTPATRMTSSSLAPNTGNIQPQKLVGSRLGFGPLTFIYLRTGVRAYTALMQYVCSQKKY